MKKIFISTIAAFLLLGSGIAIGSSINGDFNGHPIVLVKSGNNTLTDEVPAQVIDGKTMVPLTMLRQFGFDVTWNPNDYSVDVKPSQQVVEGKKLSIGEISKMDGVGLMLAYNSNGIPFKQGTGFIIDGDILLSAHHVYEKSSKMVFEDKGTTTFNQVIFDDPVADVMGVKVDHGKYPHFQYSTDIPKVGDTVFTISYPGSSRNVTEGVVQDVTKDNGIITIRHTATVDHGSSGGPLLDSKGRVIGIIERNDGSLVNNYATSIISVLDEINKMK